MSAHAPMIALAAALVLGLAAAWLRRRPIGIAPRCRHCRRPTAAFEAGVCADCFAIERE